MEDFYDQCHAIHMQLLRCLESALHLPDATLIGRCNRNTSELRLNHYPPCSASLITEGSVNRISEHTDFGTLTLLFANPIDGLEVEDQNNHGDYVPVMSEVIDVLVVNVGDALQRWTNAELRSASHRVRLPPFFTGDHIEERFSVAYFGKPNRDESVGVLPDFLKEGSPAKYAPMTAWEYNQSKLLRTY